ncbi:hypothetical protein MRX96_005258 [Rhipicephalus microplus]
MPSRVVSSHSVLFYPWRIGPSGVQASPRLLDSGHRIAAEFSEIGQYSGIDELCESRGLVADSNQARKPSWLRAQGPPR